MQSRMFADQTPGGSSSLAKARCPESAATKSFSGPATSSGCLAMNRPGSMSPLGRSAGHPRFPQVRSVRGKDGWHGGTDPSGQGPGLRWTGRACARRAVGPGIDSTWHCPGHSPAGPLPPGYLHRPGAHQRIGYCAEADSLLWMSGPSALQASPPGATRFVRCRRPGLDISDRAETWRSGWAGAAALARVRALGMPDACQARGNPRRVMRPPTIAANRGVCTRVSSNRNAEDMAFHRALAV